MANIEDDLRDLSDEEMELKKAWDRVIRHLKRKGDLAYIWEPEVKKEFLDMETSAERIEFFLEKLRKRYGIGNKKELADVELLRRNLEKIKANRKFLKLIHEELKAVIVDVEKMRSRRSFIYGVTSSAAAIAAANMFGKKIFDFFDFGKKKRVRETTDAFLSEARYARCILFGEGHGVFEDNQYVELLLPELKKMGYSVFGVEVKQDFAKLVKDFLDGKVSEAEIEKMYKEEKERETPTTRIFNSPLEMVLYGAGLRMMKYANSLGYEVIPIDSKDGVSSLQREMEIFNNVSQLLEKGKKVVVFIGASHINKNKYNKHWPKGVSPLGFLLDERYGDNIIAFNLLEDAGFAVDFHLHLVTSAFGR